MRLIEIINREAPDSEKPVVLLVGGKVLTVDPGRSVNLTIDLIENIVVADHLPDFTRKEPEPILTTQGIPVDGATAADSNAAPEQPLKVEFASDVVTPADIKAKLGAVADELHAAVTPEQPITREALEALPFPQLRTIAAGLGIKGRAKEELITEILAGKDLSRG